jgi:hypothetical protein
VVRIEVVPISVDQIGAVQIAVPIGQRADTLRDRSAVAVAHHHPVVVDARRSALAAGPCRTAVWLLVQAGNRARAAVAPIVLQSAEARTAGLPGESAAAIHRASRYPDTGPAADALPDHSPAE